MKTIAGFILAVVLIHVGILLGIGGGIAVAHYIVWLFETFPWLQGLLP